MAWQGKITGFRSNADGWELDVDFYNDVTPEIKFGRMLKLPPETTKAQAVNLIQARGAEVRAKLKLNEENLIGQIIPIP